MKYKDHIINYAIDNKVSLASYIDSKADNDEKEEKFKKAYMDEESKDHFEDENYTDPDAMEYRPDLAETESSLSPEEEEAWKMYDAMKDDLERLYKEYTEAPLTKEDLLWVEYQLRLIEQIKENNE